MLNKAEIRKLVEEKDLISGYINLETQLTPNGFDLSVGELFSFSGPGSVDFSNKERVLPEGIALKAEKRSPEDKFGWWHLEKGIYKVRTNETVSLPNDLSAIAFPRSTLLRCGAFVHNGVWDAGFRGRSEFVLVVGNPGGMDLKQNARVIQLIFYPVTETESYKGIYNNL